MNYELSLLIILEFENKAHLANTLKNIRLLTLNLHNNSSYIQIPHSKFPHLLIDWSNENAACTLLCYSFFFSNFYHPLFIKKKAKKTTTWTEVFSFIWKICEKQQIFYTIEVCLVGQSNFLYFCLSTSCGYKKYQQKSKKSLWERAPIKKHK